jgi:hypothetical protein
MGVPNSSMKAADQPSAEGLLTAFKTIDAAERQRHAEVLSYWMSIRGDKEFPPLHDLDPLEISDAGPASVLLELISGGHDADIRHLGEELRGEGWPEQIMDAAEPSILACVAKKLPIVAISRDFLAFEDEFSNESGTTRCWVTLLPLSGGGAWVDYVYALVSFETVPAKGAKAAEKPAKKPETDDSKSEEPQAKKPAPAPVEKPVAEEADEPVAEEVTEPVAEDAPVASDEIEEGVAETPVEPEENEQPEVVDEEVEEASEAIAAEKAEDVEPARAEEEPKPEAETEPQEPISSAIAKAAPGFSKLFDSLAGLTGFYAQGVKVDPVIPDEAAAEDAPTERAVVDEKPTTGRAKADEQPSEDAVAAAQIEETTKEPAAEKVEPSESSRREADVPAKAAKQPTRASEGLLQSKLQEVRAKADEARQARLRANVALYEGLSAAYDFALDAEDSPEEYLRLVEAKGLKIQLRSPMTPVVKLAFDGLCDENAIAQLEAVLAWALSEDLPKGSLADRIESAGGIAHILNGKSEAN